MMQTSKDKSIVDSRTKLSLLHKTETEKPQAKNDNTNFVQGQNFETFDLNKERVDKSIQEWIKGKDNNKSSVLVNNNVSVVQAVSSKKKE